MYSVLLVDDEPYILEGLELTVNWSKYGFFILDRATNGFDALDKISKKKFDLVITDIRMPQLNGIAFIKEIRRLDQEIEIIVISGYNRFEYAKDAISLGVRAYILKPIDPDEVLAHLEKIQHILVQNNKRRIMHNQALKLIRDYQLPDNLENSELYSDAAHNPKMPVPGNQDTANTDIAGSNSMVKAPSNVRIHGLMTQVIEFIEKNYAKNISLKSVSKVFYLNTSYLGQLFKKTTGESFNDYLNKIRIAHAKELLLSKEYKVYEAVRMTGFKSHQYFYKQFKKYEGRSFAEYNSEHEAAK